LQRDFGFDERYAGEFERNPLTALLEQNYAPVLVVPDRVALFRRKISPK